MARKVSFALDSWIRDLSNSSKGDVRDHHCGILLNLRLVQLDMSFLCAAIKFWNPQTHSFCFNNNEITPLPEEVGAIIGWPNDSPPCSPNLSEFFYKFFENFLGLEGRKISEIVHGHEVNLLKLIDHFRTMGRISSAHRIRALIFCLFCHYLFPHKSENYGFAPVIAIVEQCEVGRSPSLLCCGELLLALDDLKKDPSAPMTCCPYILQIWLMERLTLIAPPENMESYNTKSYCTRKRLYTSRFDDGWAQYFANKEFSIRWVVPWWHIERMMTSDDREGLTISGLWTLLMRQYGRKQVIPDRDTVRPTNRAIVSRSLKRWGDFWMAQPKLDVLDLDDCDATTSQFYKKWMSTNNATARAEYRVAKGKDSNRKRPLESETSYEPTPKRSKRNNASSVKDRLGPKVAPV
ncbi:hypothetical protein BVRB_9g226110 [Beta vulgaris subsp. vulgaris]|uniref:Aminotransferase-like plant mobile domain-containing protein n=1 Tax=Beta vulgaris subsp. vulgaris TaxID=3555 RepID=A0A0J8B5Q8_BETVV|nr:hypothetical protein BVRB_9g226110 [Beta vulgaris subsp. vulgaris]